MVKKVFAMLRAEMHLPWSSDHAKMRPANTRCAGPAPARASATAEGVSISGRKNLPAAARSHQHHRHGAL
jgi:hypothetical protein